MFNTITWQGYWTTLALLSAGYYLFIYLLYYRKDFKISFPKQKVAIKPSSVPAASASFVTEQNELSLDTDEANAVETYADSDERMVYACMDELSAYFESSKGTKVVKEEFVFAVQKILSKYPSLKSSEFKEAVSNLIVSEASHNCSIHLEEEDLFHVWLER
jgi:hypothetical protein